MKINRIFSVLMTLPFILAACSGTGPTAAAPTADKMMKSTPEAAMSSPTADAMTKETPDDMMKASPTADTMIKTPAWYSASLTNPVNGTTFTVNDFKGKVILVETMAIWCPTCLKQQQQVKALLDQSGIKDQVVFLTLDVDSKEDNAMLKSYIEKNGFTWNYAVASADVAREISQLYGDQFINPPSAPMLIIDTKGEAHPLPFGFKDASTLKKALEPFLEM